MLSSLYRYRGQMDYSFGISLSLTGCCTETFEYVVFIDTDTGARVSTVAPRRRCLSVWSL